MNTVNSDFELSLRAGELVRVKSKEQILATLDVKGDVERIPFMPEMLQYCGQQFTVFKRADKTCDTIEKSGGRRMMHAVHLAGVRCDGSGHGGCQARCLIFWKEAWLETLENKQPYQRDPFGSAVEPYVQNGISEEILYRAAQRHEDVEPGSETSYRCQATELRNATTPLSGWEVGQYVRDLVSRNLTVKDLLRTAAFRLFQLLLHVRGFRLWLALYDSFQRVCGGVPYPYKQGRATGKTPSEQLNLQPGDFVQIKSHDEILDTLSSMSNKNRGLWFDAEQVSFCGKTARVLCRVEQIVNERTGRMMKLPNTCWILDGVYCTARYSAGRLFCPRSIYAYWHDVWLRKL